VYRLRLREKSNGVKGQRRMTYRKEKIKILGNKIERRNKLSS
jgi:hypothetical protein